MNLWDHPKFRQPTDAVGDWRVVREALFEHEKPPTAMKHAIEKLCVQLLHREPVDIAALALRYSGSSSAGGHPSTVHLELRAVGSGIYLYALTSERSAPKRWEDERVFTAECDRRFGYWCASLRIVSSMPAWRAAPRAALEQVIHETVAAEDAAARIVEDSAPVAAVQREVLDALHRGMGFFTAGKEGGSHLFFDGNVYRRNDYGEEPNISEVYADDAAMIACLRRFYDWEAQSDTYPHRKPELAVWEHIRRQLRTR